MTFLSLILAACTAATAFIGTICTPQTPGKHPAVIVLGGSEGGDQAAPIAQRFANHGYVGVSVAYFGAPGLPATLENIPIETFGKALDAVSKRSDVDAAHMAVMGYSKGGEFDTRNIVLQTVKLRAEKAKLLGYDNWAAYQLEDQTAHNVPTVNKLLADLAPPSVANAKSEATEQQKIVDQEKGGFQIAAADWDFYSEKVRKAKYNFDESEVRPYYELNHVVVDGVFYAAQKLYGLTFKERHDLPVYQPDVRVWEVFDRDGNRSRFSSAIITREHRSAAARG